MLMIHLKKVFFSVRQDALLENTIKILTQNEMQTMIKNKEHFDLLIVEWSINPILVILSHRFNCPMIGVKALPLHLEGHDSMGNPTYPSCIPMGYTNLDITFWGRLKNFLIRIIWRSLYQVFVIPEARSIVRDFFPII